jgi:poly-gamma-glutamate capsule biosynthesis protein CapA/YwtB (metallophosphatase superfamily)
VGDDLVVYRGRLILYGGGDFIDDYEGIAGHREYRDDLRLMYFASLRRGTGELAELRMVPMQARKLRLSHASGQDRRWAGSDARPDQPPVRCGGGAGARRFACASPARWPTVAGRPQDGDSANSGRQM